MTTDRAARLADLIISLKGASGPEINTALLERYPDMTNEEFLRSFAIAEEVMIADAAEFNHEAAQLRAEIDRRKTRGAQS